MDTNQQNEQSWSYTPEPGESVAQMESKITGENEVVTWTASEFISHTKGARWYLMLVLGGVVVVGVTFLLTKDVGTSVIMAIVVALLGYFANRKPRILQYSVSREGIVVGTRLYTYDMFKSFTVSEEGAIDSIHLMPLKRFMPTIIMYFAPEDEKRIVTSLGTYLPVEEHNPDVLDKLMSRIRF